MRPRPGCGSTGCSATDPAGRIDAARSSEDVRCRSTCACDGDSARPELFLEPVQLHFHLADLLIELGQKLLLILLLRGPTIGEQLFSRINQMLFPLRDLAGVYLMFTGQFRDAPMTFDGL